MAYSSTVRFSAISFPSVTHASRQTGRVENLPKDFTMSIPQFEAAENVAHIPLIV